jgi:molybdate transport system ATP-binding protein
MATPNEAVAVVGPNGAGKTTLLRVLAGLQPADEARIVVDGRDIAGLPAERRPVGVVFQDGVLFPHLSALDNVAFGLRAGGIGRRAARAEAGDWLARVGLADRADDRPGALSGGQAQRVGLARALATRPRLLLLDEPLSALDATTRVEVRRFLGAELGSFDGARVLVTHDPLEAMTLADRLVVLEAGRVVQEGSPAEVSARPRSAYVADLVGLNLFRGRADGAGNMLVAGATLHAVGTEAGDVFAVVHPRAVALHRARPEGTPRNVWPVRVVHVERLGDRARVAVDGPLPLVAEVTPAAVDDLGLAAAQPFWASVKATEVAVYPA